MQNVWFKSRTRDVCGRFVVAVSFAEGNVRANGACDRVVRVSNAVEIRLQELRSSAVTRGREWLQDALRRNFRSGASQNGRCSECWPWTGQEVVCG